MEIKTFNFCVRMVIADQYLVFSWKQKVSECNLSDLRAFVWANRDCRELVPYTFERIIIYSESLCWSIELFS